MNEIQEDFFGCIPLSVKSDIAHQIALACHEIHKREIDKLRTELYEGAELAMKINRDKMKRILEILLETTPSINEAIEKFGEKK
jgi:hypothetical protein